MSDAENLKRTTKTFLEALKTLIIVFLIAILSLLIVFIRGLTIICRYMALFIEIAAIVACAILMWINLSRTFGSDLAAMMFAAFVVVAVLAGGILETRSFTKTLAFFVFGFAASEILKELPFYVGSFVITIIIIMVMLGQHVDLGLEFIPYIEKWRAKEPDQESQPLTEAESKEAVDESGEESSVHNPNQVGAADFHGSEVDRPVHVDVRGEGSTPAGGDPGDLRA